jgi:hypothetical protein
MITDFISTLVQRRGGCPRFVAVLVFVVVSQSAQAVIFDDFNRANSDIVGNGWSEIETTTTGARIASNALVLGSTIAGREYVYRSPSSEFTTLSGAAGLVTWSFNMQQTRTDPSGFDNSNYGAAFILASTSSDATTGSGYAIVLGQSGTTDALRLVRFTNGPDANANFTNIISSGDFGTEHLNIRVTFDPSTNNWSLFATSGTSFSDPSLVTTQLGATTADSTYTGLTFNSFGAFWNHATGSGESATFDNISLSVVPEPSTWAAGILSVGAVLWTQRKRLKRKSAGTAA